MTLIEIKAAVEAGHTVCWKTRAYEVRKGRFGQWFIVCALNNDAIGLTWIDGITMNGKEEDFFIVGE